MREALAAAIKAQWVGEWGASGVDRALELADLLLSVGVSSIAGGFELQEASRAPVGGGTQWVMGREGELQEVSAEPTAWTYTYGRKIPLAEVPAAIAATSTTYGGNAGLQVVMLGKRFGFIGDYNNDGSINNGNKSVWMLKPGGMVAWSARGHGNVGYHVGLHPRTGKLQMAPAWGSSSDMDQVRTVAALVATVLTAGAASGAFAGGTVAAEGAAAGGAAAGATGGATGAATNAALIESAVGTAGYGASSAGLGGGATAAWGAGAGYVADGVATGATNPALIESAVGTPGYGASSAGAGGAGGSSWWSDALNKAGEKVVEKQGERLLDTAIGKLVQGLMPSAPSGPANGSQGLQAMEGGARQAQGATWPIVAGALAVVALAVW